MNQSVNRNTTPPGKEVLQLKVQTGAIKHLGISLYHRPVDVVSELVANAWDADATHVNIEVNPADKEIVVSDDGIGMTYEEVQNLYLQMGRDRRAATGKTRTKSGRPILGRKGIGKFSGLGIARSIKVETTSRATHEYTEFEMKPDFNDAFSTELEDLIVHQEWSEQSQYPSSGTIVKLKSISNSLDTEMQKRFRKSLARRFLLYENVSDLPFVVSVNGTEIEKPFQEEKQFDFPNDLTEAEIADFEIDSVDENGWALTTFQGHPVMWRIGYSKTPIKEDELRGIAIFAHGKLAQNAFFFDQQGGSSADLAKEYITGQIKMDFVDEELDLISPERQRLQLESDIGKEIKNWGLSLLNKLNNIWKKRRAEKRVELIFDSNPNEEVRKRIKNLLPSEQRTIKDVLRKIAEGSSRLEEHAYKNIANDLITAYEKGRLKRLIDEIAALDSLNDTSTIVELVSETGILADLQIGEAIKTKIETLAKLKDMIANEEKENVVRDFIAVHPWLVNPKFETFKQETSIYKTIISACDTGFFNESDVYNGRIDLMLSNSQKTEFLLLEFMRPGKKLDIDHIQRLKRYVFDIKTHLTNSTNHDELKNELREAWIVAEPANHEYAKQLIRESKENRIYFVDWTTFFQNGLNQYSDSLDILKSRNDDPRIEAL